jgi:cold shock CspA family protein
MVEFGWSNGAVTSQKDHTMTYDFNSSDRLTNDVPNPFKFENTFMFITAAVTMAGAIPVILTAKHLFQAHDDKLAAATLALAMILGGVSMKTLIKALAQVRYFLGRRYPLGLAGELPVTETGVGVGTEELLETLRHRTIHFPEPQGALNGLLYSLVKDLITSPGEIQAAAVQHFHSIISMVALLVSLGVSFVVFSGTAHEGMASWLYLPMCGLTLLAPFTQQERLSVDATPDVDAGDTSANGAMGKLAGLMFFSILAPVVIPRVLPAYPIPAMWIAPVMLLTGSIIASLLFFSALTERLDSASHTSVSCEQTTIAMNCAPAQLWTAISRDFQDSWERSIPNRAYANVPPDVSEGERGSFGGFIVEETQPVPTSTMQYRTWSEAVEVTSSRMLLLLGAWGVVCASAGSLLAAYFAENFANMQRMEISRVFVVVMAFCMVAVLSHKIGHLLWSRMQFKSRLYWIETSGTFQSSQIAIGNQLRGHTQSTSTLTRIEDATLRVWVTDVVSVAFGKDGRRSIIAMASADSVAKGMADRLVAFAADQSSVAMPTSRQDLARAQSIGTLDAAVRSAVVAAQGKEPASIGTSTPTQQLAGEQPRKLGKVKFFSAEKGYGFIRAQDSSEYFFNANYVLGDAPTGGAEVEFEPGQSSRGAIAKRVRVRVTTTV